MKKEPTDSMVYGDGTGLWYGGKGVKIDKAITGTAYFNHAYLLNWMGGKSRHFCLGSGYWCWQNFLRYPQDIIKYFEFLARRSKHSKKA